MRPRISPRGLPRRGLLGRGCVPKDGLCPSECPPHFLFLLAKKKTCRTRYKRKSVRDELTRKGPTHPKRGAGRYALPIKSKSFLPAAPKHIIYNGYIPASGGTAFTGLQRGRPLLPVPLPLPLIRGTGSAEQRGERSVQAAMKTPNPPTGCADRRSLQNCAPASGGAELAGLQRGRPLLLVPLPLALICGTGSAEQREERGKRN